MTDNRGRIVLPAYASLPKGGRGGCEVVLGVGAQSIYDEGPGVLLTAKWGPGMVLEISLPGDTAKELAERLQSMHDHMAKQR